MFEVKTMKGSLVTAKMAGMESTAKTTSVTSTVISAMNSGVAKRRPSLTMVKRGPWFSVLTGRIFRNVRTTGFCSG